MDRITDSGSVDWGSTPHGRTMLKKFFAVILWLAGCAVAFSQNSAQSYDFNWSSPSSLFPPLKAPDSGNRNGEYLSGITFTNGPVSLTVSDDNLDEDSQSTRLFWALSTETVEMRAYPGAMITISVPVEEEIKRITFLGDKVSERQLSCIGNTGKISGNTWLPTSQPGMMEVRFRVDATINCTCISVSVSDAGVDEMFSATVPESSNYYTLRGERLSRKPKTPGIYLRGSASGFQKIIVR